MTGVSARSGLLVLVASIATAFAIAACSRTDDPALDLEHHSDVEDQFAQHGGLGLTEEDRIAAYLYMWAGVEIDDVESLPAD